ncbi:MAG: hypothetical protein ABIO70_15295 [Pseudomonadota bacterium]
MSSRRALLLAGLALVHLVAAWLLIVPGWLSIDEGVYDAMAAAMSRGSVFIENGYSERPSPELTIQIAGMDQHIEPVGGQLVAQYPQMASVLVAPLYRWEGYRALFHVNAFAFLLAVALTFRLGRTLHEDPRVADVGAALFALCTFAWPYSVGAWPHMIHLVLVLGGVTAVFQALQTPGRGALSLALVAGLSLGMSLGVRLDGLFVVAALGLVLLYQRRVRWREGLAIGLGLLPGLLFLSLTNHVKFGTWMPLSYGPHAKSSIMSFLPAVAPGLLVLAARAMVYREGLRGVLARHRGKILVAGGLMAAASLALPSTRGLLLPWVRSAWGLSVALTVGGLGIDRAGFEAGPGGGLYYYIGGFKKALVQSMPWLALALVPIVGWLRGRREDRHTPALLLIPAILVAVYSQRGRHGGLSLGLRYLLPALPLLAVLVAPTVRSLLAQLRGRRVALAVVVALGVAAALSPLARPLEVGPHERLVLGGPLVLAALLAGLVLLGWLPSLAESSGLRLGTALATVAALSWAAGVTFGYDTRLERRARLRTLSIAQAVQQLLPERALLLADWPDPFLGAMASGSVRLALPSLDGGRDLPALIDHHAARGWPVCVAFGRPLWEQLLALPVMQRYEAAPLGRVDALYVGRLIPRATEAP